VPRTRGEARVEQARVLASQGRTQAEVAAEIGVDARTLRRWGIAWPMGRPEVAEGQASPRTRRRRKAGDPAGLA
jgi:transposase-like protein